MFETDLQMHHERETPWDSTTWEWGNVINNEENNEDLEEGNGEYLTNEEYLEAENPDQSHDKLQELAQQMIDAEMMAESHM